MKSSGGGDKLDRKTVEKNRRMHMKSLCLKLFSLIPKEEYTISKEVLTQKDGFEQVASYIKRLRERMERLKQKKKIAANVNRSGMNLPAIQVRLIDSNLEVVLISDLAKRFQFHEVISLLEEEGAVVVNASFSIVGDKVFHTIHSQALSSGIGLEASRIWERLDKLVRGQF